VAAGLGRMTGVRLWVGGAGASAGGGRAGDGSGRDGSGRGGSGKDISILWRLNSTSFFSVCKFFVH
jgi:hypothetical protein